jgi:creatinine amidohydrolase/Fe(II)-dependent formamide hydrolase-like protein
MLRGVRVAVMPLGSWEQHGESLPLYTDTMIACAVAGELAERLGAALLPPLAYGVSQEHMDFPLTATLAPETLCRVLSEIWGSLERHGVEAVVVVNGHGGNKAALEACASQWNYTRRMKVIPITVWDFVEGLEEGDVHAGRGEASMVAYLQGGEYEGEGRLCTPMYPLRRTAECSPTGSVYPGRWRSDRGLGERLLKGSVERVYEASVRALEALGVKITR